jgi:hypothetical protein
MSEDIILQGKLWGIEYRKLYENIKIISLGNYKYIFSPLRYFSIKSNNCVWSNARTCIILFLGLVKNCNTGGGAGKTFNKSYDISVVWRRR